MAGDLEFVGAKAQFVDVARRLNAQGSAGRGLWRELNAEMRTAAQPMTDTVLRHLDQYLPSGYAPVMRAGLTVRVSRSTKGASAGLKLVGTAKGRKKKRHVKVINDGTLRHPVWAHADRWVNQRVKPGFWTETLTATREIPAKAIRRAVQSTLRKI